MTNRVLTTRQAAEQLGVSLRTVQLWVESGILNAWKTAGGHRRIAEESVQDLLTDQREALGRQPHTAPLRVLVVEDEATLLQLYRLTIDSWKLDIHVETASNGFEGMIHLGRTQPDILITDLVMPHIDGLEMIRILRSRPEYDNTDIIVVSTLTAEEVERRGGLPADIIRFDKPIPFDAIQALVRKRIAQTPAQHTPSPVE